MNMKTMHGIGSDISIKTALEQENAEIARQKEFNESPIGQILTSRTVAFPHHKMVMMSNPK
jgi:hypothetical protein